MTDELEWFVCRGEGYLREPVALSVLKRDGPRYPIFGAQLGDRCVMYDRILAARGRGPYRVVNLADFTLETRAA